MFEGREEIPLVEMRNKFLRLYLNLSEINSARTVQKNNVALNIKREMWRCGTVSLS